MAPPIMAVPTEILQLILGHLGVGEVVSCGQTCRKWKSLLNNDWSFMEKVDVSHFYKVSRPDPGFTQFELNSNHKQRFFVPNNINAIQCFVLHTLEMLIQTLINFQTCQISRLRVLIFIINRR